MLDNNLLENLNLINNKLNIFNKETNNTELITLNREDKLIE